MNLDTTSASLLVRVRDTADHAAWHEFDQRYRELIARYAASRGLQAADVEDVQQNVMLSLCSALPGFRYEPGRGKFRSYLGWIVRNAVVRRQQARAGQIQTSMEALLAASNPSEICADWEREWMNHHFRRALARMQGVDAGTLSVFQRLLDGGSVEEVARDLQMSVDAVRKARQRTRARLEALVAEQIREEDGE